MPNHYKYAFDNITNTYNFVTKNNILYKVAFIVDETFSTFSKKEITNVFQLIVEKASDDLEPFDAKVSKTIGDIVERFFKNIENSLIYICSEEDDKAKARHEIFNRWYQNSKYREIIIKIDNIIEINTYKEIQKLYTSFLFHKQNSNSQKLIKIYNRIGEVLNDDKGED